MTSVSSVAAVASRDRRAPGRSTRLRVIGVGAALVLLGALSVLSLVTGSGDITMAEAWAALGSDGRSTTELIVRDFRVPRTILALLCGLALALAGVAMQALTRNPLADPGLLGVNAGAYFAVVVGTAYLGVGLGPAQVLSGVLGAGIAAAVVFVLGTTGPGAGTPAKLVLAGVAIAAVLSGVSAGITLSNPEVFDRLRFWSVGSLQGRTLDSVTTVVVPILAAALAVVLLARSFNAMSMGEDLARSLGARTGRVRVLGFAAIAVLCGAATAVTGPISFVGLMVPFVARFVVGVDHRWIICFCVIVGPALLVGSDIVGRLLVPSELPVGVVTAFVGAPVLVVLVRRTRIRSL